MITHDKKIIEILREGGKILAQTLSTISLAAKPGISAFELNRMAEQELKKAGALPSFLNYSPSKGTPKFPSSICVSLNDEVVHGIATKEKILQDGDIVGLDLGVKYRGFFTDAAVTVAVGNVSKNKIKLINATKDALESAILAVRPAATIGDISYATQATAEEAGFDVIRDLVGHGVGAAVHEPPDVPCFGEPNSGPELVEGMVLAIEPMLTAGSHRIVLANDRWTILTADKSPSAHFEHTVIVTKNGCEILTKL